MANFRTALECRAAVWYNCPTMKRTKSVLLLLNHQSYSPTFPEIAAFAKGHGWRLAIEDRLAPPWGWTGDGVLVNYLDHPQIRKFTEGMVDAGIPVVDMFNGILSSPRAWTVCIDGAACGRMAATHFRERGYSRAAWFSLIWTNLHARMFDGFARAFGPGVESWVWMRKRAYPCGYDRTALLEDLEGRLRAASKPLAVFAFDTYNATFILQACECAGLKVPDDVIVLAGNNVPHISNAQLTPISGVEYSPKVVGDALDVLEKAMSGRPPARRRIEIPPLGIVERESTNMVTADHPNIAKALRFIVNHLSEDITAEDIAVESGLSRSGIDKIFHARLGRTVRAEILRQRILRAKALLADTDEKLDVVAGRTGFCHDSYFIKVFRRETGLTPFAWRKANARR